MGRLGTVLALAMLCFGPMLGDAMAQEATPQRYTAEIARGLAAKMPDAKVTVLGEFELSVRRAEGRETRLQLRNRYNEYKTDPGRLGRIVADYHEGIEKPAVATVDRARIVPVIKNRAWLAGNERSLAARGVKSGGMPAQFLSEDYNDELVILYAMDEEKRTRYLMADEQIGVARKDLRKLAVENLDRLLPSVQLAQAGDIAMMTANGDYEASLLLLDQIWRGGKVKVNGDIVVAVPAKDVLLITGSKSRKGIAAVRELAAKYKAESRYEITDTLFVYRDGRFVKFTGK